MERPRGRLREPANRAAWTLSEGRGIQRLSGPLGIGERGLSMTGNRCNSCFALRVMFRRGKKKSWRGQSEGQGQGGRIPLDGKGRSVWDSWPGLIARPLEAFGAHFGVFIVRLYHRLLFGAGALAFSWLVGILRGLERPGTRSSFGGGRAETLPFE